LRVVGVWEGVVRSHEVFGEEGVPFDAAQDDELMLLANSVSGYRLGELTWGFARYSEQHEFSPASRFDS
jgi:hypothetical protein